MTDLIREELQRGISSLSLNCNEEMFSSLLAYIDLLKKWNSAYNLLGGNESDSLVSRHILDSLSVDPYLEGNLIADIGAGAGLPGIPLAILNPGKNFVLIDANGKKTRFMFQAKIQLDLDNISIKNSRIEHYQSIQQIDMVTCKLLAMKGHYPEEEIARLPDGFELSKTIKLNVPGSKSQRHLIEVMRTR
jgi:16S rRNA (guanine527-N7)-methyltransferase